MLEVERKARNETKLQEMHPVFRKKVKSVLIELEQAGLRPRIQEAWRSEEMQKEAFKRGTSKVEFGYHNATAKDGTKEALAADIIDDDNPSGLNLPYILHLAAAADHNGLESGVRWDLDDTKLAGLNQAIADKDWDAKVYIGWDPLHVEIKGLTLAEVKNGKRPAEESEENKEDEKSDDKEQEDKMGTYKVENLETGKTIEYKLETALRPVSLVPVPYKSQLGEGADAHRNDCGAASAVMLIKGYLNVDMTPDDFYAKYAITGDPYLSITQLRTGMGGLGLLTDMRAGLTIQDLFNVFAQNKPAIVLLRYKVLQEAGLTEKTFQGPHFAVAVGMDTKYIYIHDPLYTDPAVGEAHPYPLDIFWKAWKEVALDPNVPNPERAAIIPIAGIGSQLTRKVKVNTNQLNIRSAPSLSSGVVGKLNRNQVVSVLREVNGFGEIGTNQWIYMAYTVSAE
jgi:hypothetical protein